MLSDTEVQRLVDERSELKRQRNFADADAIRNQLEYNNITLHDEKGITTWSRDIINVKSIKLNHFGEAFERDYSFYLTNKDTWTFSGHLPEEWEEDLIDGYSAKVCMYAYETDGVKLPCKDVKLLQSLVQCKGAINFQIKDWVDGYYTMMCFIDYYEDAIKDTMPGAPSWVLTSLKNQLESKYPSLIWNFQGECLGWLPEWVPFWFKIYDDFSIRTKN